MNYTNEKLPTAVLLYCGVGGCAMGLHWAGWRQLLAADWNDVVERNWPQNFKPDTEKFIPFVRADLWTLTADDIMRMALIECAGMLDLLCITSPCEGFSDASNDAHPCHELNGNFLLAIDKISGIRPKTFFFENVPGMLSKRQTPIWNEIVTRFEEKLPEYRVFCFKVCCLYFGVPTSRERLLFIGIRKDIYTKEPVLTAATPDIEQFQISKVAPGIKKISFGQSKKITHFADEYMPTITAGEGVKLFEDGVWKPLSECEHYLKLFSSFPADFILDGTPAQKNGLVGDAVPCNLMYHIGMYIKHEILGYPRE